MQVIPVLDLMHGMVVHARRGERARYAPLSSPLARSAAPLDVVAGILAWQPFETMYIADLDAIAGGDGHAETIVDIAERHPQLRILLDGGFDCASALDRYRGCPTIDFVLGTETLPSRARYLELLERATGARAVLSLDRDASGPLGLSELFDTPASWPERVIHMTLAQVGSAAGPDWVGLEALCAGAPGRRIYAAGGVRDEADLDRLARCGVAGALVATALHDGRIRRHRVTV